MSDYKSAQAFVIKDMPFGEAGRIFYDGFYDAALAFCSVPAATWDDDDFKKRINSIFYDRFSAQANRPDPHLSEGLYGNLRGYSNEVQGGDTRVFLVLRELFRSSVIAEAQLNRRRTPTRHLDGKHATENSNFGRVKALLPSPLCFLRRYLTAPSYLASEAYAHAVTRSIIFASALRFFGETPKTKLEQWDRIRSFILFEDVVASLRKIESHIRKRDNLYPTTPADFIVMNLLASKGYLLMMFAPGTQQYELRGHERFQVGRETFLTEHSLVPSDGIYEFRRISTLRSLPSASELMNEIDGLPIPIPGASQVFANGFRLTESEGTVWRLSGKSGSGKTSLALGLSTALAPLGVTTVYISCEEASQDLEGRIETLVPEFVRRTSSYNLRRHEWFEAHAQRGSAEQSLKNIFQFLQDYIERFGSEGQVSPRYKPPGLVPLMIVLDGVHELLLQDTSSSAPENSVRLRELVSACRRTGALVLLLTAATDSGELADLDYLVDGVIRVEIEGTEKPGSPPLRKLIVQKARRQYAHMGAHVLHLSPRSGMQISPQLAAQRDQLRNVAWSPIDSKQFLDVFRYAASGPNFRAPVPLRLVKIAPGSQTLVSGRGSGGKAGLALRILMAPTSDDVAEGEADGRLSQSLRASRQAELFLELLNRETGIHSSQDWLKDVSALTFEGLSSDAVEAFGQQVPVGPMWDALRRQAENVRSRRRILVLSFLYDEGYYETLRRNVRRNLASNTRPGSKEIPIDVEVIQFYPGFLTPEDFQRIVSNKIEEAELHGAPFFGVLVDGLHNVYLQFPVLQDAEMIWPIFYELLRKRGLTVVTTHTHFDVHDPNAPLRFSADVEGIARRSEPLLHALVAGADFFVDLQPVETSGSQTRDGRRKALQPNLLEINFRSSIGQSPRQSCFWSRDLLRVVAEHDLPRLELSASR